MINVVYFSLGSNIGRRKDNINKALELLNECGVKITTTSGFYETEPVSLFPQKYFFNLCAEGETEAEPSKLLQICKNIEKEIGRKMSRLKAPGYYEPRIIDIDILLYGQKIIRKRNLIIPHKKMHLRRFVLEPLNEIDPYINHPVLHKNIKELLIECWDTGEVIRRGDAIIL